MNIQITSAQMRKDPEEGFVGQVVFTVEGHPKPYEITLFSKKGKEWEYGLHFAESPGSEELIDEVEAYLEENDETFDALVAAAMKNASLE